MRQFESFSNTVRLLGELGEVNFGMLKLGELGDTYLVWISIATPKIILDNSILTEERKQMFS